MNPFENGKKHHNKSFWKIIGTLIMIKPNCKILPPPPKVTGSVQIGWANRVKHFAIFLLFFGSDFPLHAVHFLTLVLCQRDEKPNWVISSKSTNFRALQRGRPFFCDCIYDLTYDERSFANTQYMTSSWSDYFQNLLRLARESTWNLVSGFSFVSTEMYFCLFGDVSCETEKYWIRSSQYELWPWRWSDRSVFYQPCPFLFCLSPA